MSKKRQYRCYPAKFKEEAVKLVAEEGYSVTQAADSLGISSTLLYK